MLFLNILNKNILNFSVNRLFIAHYFRYTFLFFVGFCFQIHAAKLSLKDCQQLAIENSERMNLADLQILIEKDRVDEIKAIGRPQIKANADYVAAGEAHKFLKKHKTANAKASLIVPLFNFGGSTSRVNEQKVIYRSSFYDRDRVKQEILYEVSQAYYRLLESQQIEGIVADSLTTLKEQFRISKDFYSQGLIHKNDMLLIEVQLAQRNQDLIDAKQNIALSLVQLNRMMGVGLCEKTEIQDVVVQEYTKPSLEEILILAKSCHPELSSLQARIEAANLSYCAEKGTLYPAFFAFTDYSTTNDYSFPYTHGINAGIGMQVNLYDGGATYARISRKQKEYVKLQCQYQALEDDIELAVRSAYLQIDAYLSKILLAEKSIQIAMENLKISQEHYQEGLLTTFDLLNDEEKLAEARSNYCQALYDFYKAHLDLSFSAGIIQ